MPEREKIRIAVVSDTHGAAEEIKDFVSQQGPFDSIFHAGDLLPDLYEAASKIQAQETNQEQPCSFFGVAGNCDAIETPKKILVEIEDVRIVMVHGHLERVNEQLMQLKYTAQEENARIVAFGHSHIPANMEQDDILFFNPGSLTKPRGGNAPTAGVLELKAGEILNAKIIPLKA